MGYGSIAKPKVTEKQAQKNRRSARLKAAEAGTLTTKFRKTLKTVKESAKADKGMPRKGAMKWWQGAAKRYFSSKPAMKKKTKHQEALDAAQGKK